MFYIPIRLRTQGAPLSAQAFQLVAALALALAAVVVVLQFAMPLDNNGRPREILGGFTVAGILAAAGLVLRLVGDAVAGIYEVRDSVRELLRKD